MELAPKTKNMFTNKVQIPNFITANFVPGINSASNIQRDHFWPKGNTMPHVYADAEKDYLTMNERKLVNEKIPEFNPIRYLGLQLKAYAKEQKILERQKAKAERIRKIQEKLDNLRQE